MVRFPSVLEQGPLDTFDSGAPPAASTHSVRSYTTQLSLRNAEVAVKMILDLMAESLTHGQRIEIRGFGSFDLNQRPPRVGRNPKSGEMVRVPAKYVPHFKAGKELRERVRNR